MLLVAMSCSYAEKKGKSAIKQPCQPSKTQEQRVKPSEPPSKDSFRYYVLLHKAPLEPFVAQLINFVQIEQGCQFAHEVEWEDNMAPYNEVVEFFCAEGLSLTELLQRFEKEFGLKIETRIDKREYLLTIRVCKTKLNKQKAEKKRLNANGIRLFTAHVPKKLIKLLQRKRHQPFPSKSWEKSLKEVPYYQALCGLTGSYNPLKIDLLKLVLTLAGIKVRFERASDNDITYLHVAAPAIITGIPSPICKKEIIFVDGLIDFYIVSMPYEGDWICHAWMREGFYYATSTDKPSLLKDVLRERLDFWRGSSFKGVLVMDYKEFVELRKKRPNLIEVADSR